jgi:GT2 family glycosyltransferase
VDFCVRVREAGYTNLITPFAQLYHYESKSRGLDESPEKRARFVSEVKRFQTRWAKQLAAGDPCMNPNFDDMKEDFTFKIKPLE